MPFSPQFNPTNFIPSNPPTIKPETLPVYLNRELQHLRRIVKAQNDAIKELQDYIVDNAL